MMEKDTLLDEALSMLCVFGMDVSVGTVRWCGVINTVKERNILLG